MLCMQNPHGRNELESIGVDKLRLVVIGDPKFDTLPNSSQKKRDKIRQKLKIAPLSMVWVAGSTHEGEEQTLLDVHIRLRKEFGNLTLILAPRRLERSTHIARVIMTKGISFVRRSDQWDKEDNTFSVLLLDTIGELAEVYSICDLAFVGNSFLAPGGGHNLIEPVAQGKPVLFGPFVENNRHNAIELIKSGLGVQVSSADEMEEAVRRWLLDKIERAKLEGRAKGFILHNQGASRRMADLIDDQLKS